MKSVLLVLFLAALVVADVAPLLHTNGVNVVQGSYIIVLKESLSEADRDAHILSIQSTYGVTAQYPFSIGSLIGFSADLSKEVLAAVLSHPDVKYVEANQVMSINYQQEKNARAPLATVTQTGATWGLVRTSQRKLALSPANYLYNETAGAGVTVYVIDTGILTTHKDFDGRATAAFTAYPNEPNEDKNGHGTHCAGTIGGTTYGIAKKVSLKAVRVLNSAGSGTTAGVIAGVDFVNKDKTGKAVASMSLGGGVSTTLDAAVANSIVGGTVYAIAAGNDNANACNYSPARVSTAITVGATTNADGRSSFSNIGTCVDIFAPGTAITSDWIGATNEAINTISGTSMATPHVAGVLAIFLSENTPLDPASTEKWLLAQATPGVITNPGTGSPNLLLYSL